MWLKRLSVLNFKNYSEGELEFSSGVNAFTGKNGAGKTNLLDAIHYLSLCKSYFNPIDSQQIKTGENWFMVQGTFHKDGVSDVVSCAVKRNQKKQFRRNKKEYNRLADHIGLFPLVMITPNDNQIIIEGSEFRRRFMDNVISQTDNQYLDTLIKYNKVLQQRNTLLKQAKGQYQLDLSLLQVFDGQLVDIGNQIYKRRLEFIEEFLPDFVAHYNFLSEEVEEVKLTYKSPLENKDFQLLLDENLEKDRYLERTSQGIHRDDLVFTIHQDMPLKKFGSQGQQKTFLIALKLAQFSFLKRNKKINPLLLLDDIFDRLDQSRTKKLMDMVSEENFGQIFITDVDTQRLSDIFEQIHREVRIFEIENAEAKLKV